MEVTIHSNVMGIVGSTVITTDPQQTVGSLIYAFCEDKNIRPRSDFTLSNCHQEVLHKSRRLESYEIRNGEELYLSLKESDKWPCGCNQWYVLAVVTFFIGAIGITAICIIKSFEYVPTYSYGIGFDAGSSHTKIFLYKWPAEKMNNTGIVEEVYSSSTCNSHTMKPLSSFVDNPSMAGEQLRWCLDAVKPKIPRQEVERTPVFLGATAGMRLLRQSNSSAAEAIMQSVRQTISSYPFLFTDDGHHVRIIEGSEEGAYGWISTNYLSGMFGFFPMARVKRSLYSQPTLGALDLGGASTQITFVPENLDSLPNNYSQTVSLYGTNHKMYAQSYQCYGVNEAHRRYLAQLVRRNNFSRVITDPCARNGSTNISYSFIFQVPCTLFNHSQVDPRLQNSTFEFIGSSNSSECHSLTRALFDFNASCPLPTCSFNGVYQPPVHGQFLGFSGFYYTLEYFKLVPGNFTFQTFIHVTDSYCNNATREAHQRPYCFFMHLIQVLLIDGYGFNESNWHQLTFSNKVSGADLGWILGMMINTTTTVPVSMKIESISLPVFILLIILFIAFLLLSVGFLCHARRRRHHCYEVMPETPTTTTTTYGAI